MLSIGDIVAEVRDSGYRSVLPGEKRFFPPLRDASSSEHRPQRVEENIAIIEDYILACLEIRNWREQTPAFLAELNNAARELHELLNEKERDPGFVKALAKYKPSCVAPNRGAISREAELAAIRRTSYAAEVREALKPCTMGRPTDRSFITALFEYQAYGWSRPEIRGGRSDLLQVNATLDYVFENARTSPGAKDESSVYQTFAAMLERHDPDVVLEQNVMAVKELQKTFPRVGVNCTIDATKIPGPYQQGRTRSGSRLDEVLSRGEEVGQIHHDGDEVTRGWYFLVIADMDSGVPIVWKMFPGTKHVQEGSIELMHRLFELWKDCPIETLVGDREFSQSGRFSEELVFGFGVHPVFQIRANHGVNDRWRKTFGVPVCSKHGVMSWKQRAKFKSAKKRRTEGLEPGQWVGDRDTHIVWECRPCEATRAREIEERKASKGKGSDNVGKPKRSGYTRTYVKDNPVLYTTLPQFGDSKYHMERKALLRYRSSVESLFSAFKRRGNGCAGPSKCMWSETMREAEWLNAATLLGITLSRVVHMNGDYAREEAAMRDAGLI